MRITASRSDDEFWRIDRLRNVAANYYLWLVGRDEFEPTTVLGIDDHKGELTVYWEKEPHSSDTFAMDQIWGLHGEPNTKHVVGLDNDE